MAYELGAAAIGAGAGLLGIGLNQQGNQQQMQQQQQLMQQQFQNQQALNLQNQQIQQQNWDYTNYSNQVKHMENAGLNVGLMYGMGGGGGQSMGSGGGGSAASGNAPQNTGPQIMAQMLQAGMMQSEIERNKAQANDLNASADKKRGVDTENVSADTALKNVNRQLAEIEQRVGEQKEPFRIDEYLANVNKLQSEARSSLVKANIDEQTQKTQVEMLDKKLIQVGLENILLQADTKLTNERIRQVGQDIINSIDIKLATMRNAYTNERNVWNNEYETKIKKELGNRGIDVQEQGQIIDLFKTVLGATLISQGNVRPTITGYR